MVRMLFLVLLGVSLRADTAPGLTAPDSAGSGAPPAPVPALTGPSADSLSAVLRAQLAVVTSPALEARKGARRVMQRSGYVNVLADVLQEDGLAAVLSLARMNAQIEFTLSHRQLYISVPISSPAGPHTPPPYLFTYTSSPWRIPLRDDWSMPEDPWRR